MTELPLLLLAFLMIPLLVGPFLWDLSTTETTTFAALNVLIWVMFGADLAVKVVVSPHRVKYFAEQLAERWFRKTEQRDKWNRCLSEA